MRYVFPLLLSFVLFLSACSQLSEEEIMQRARQAYQAGNYDEAFKHFQLLYNEHPKSPFRPEALFAKASIQQNHRRDYPSAVQLYRRLADEYPNDGNAPGALFLVGFIYNNELKMLDSAKVVYDEFIKRYPKSEMIPSAQFELANLGKEPGEFIQSSSEAKVAEKGVRSKQ